VPAGEQSLGFAVSNELKAQEHFFCVLITLGCPLPIPNLRQVLAVFVEVTKLNYQLVGKTKYFDAAGFPGRSIGLNEQTSDTTNSQ
jgi:hypothetical protein